MLKKVNENAFEFVGERPVPLLRRTTEQFWHVVEQGEKLIANDSSGMPCEYSDGKNSWYPAMRPDLFQKPAVVPITEPVKESVVAPAPAQTAAPVAVKTSNANTGEKVSE